jgi:hypothetical protein
MIGFIETSGVWKNNNKYRMCQNGIHSIIYLSLHTQRAGQRQINNSLHCTALHEKHSCSHSN